MPEDLIDPPDDDEPWGYDYEGDEIYLGDEVVDVEGVNVPIVKAADFLVSDYSKVDTEEYRHE